MIASTSAAAAPLCHLHLPAQVLIEHECQPQHDRFAARRADDGDVRERDRAVEREQREQRERGQFVTVEDTLFSLW